MSVSNFGVFPKLSVLLFQPLLPVYVKPQDMKTRLEIITGTKGERHTQLSNNLHSIGVEKIFPIR